MTLQDIIHRSASDLSYSLLGFTHLLESYHPELPLSGLKKRETFIGVAMNLELVQRQAAMLATLIELSESVDRKIELKVSFQLERDPLGVAIAFVENLHKIS